MTFKVYFLKQFEMATPNTRSHTELYLLHQPVVELSSIRLASNGEVLGLFCHLHLSAGHSKREAATSVVEQAIQIWDRARIPTCRKDHAVTKLEQLYKVWTNLKKHKDRRSSLHSAQEEEFCDKMYDLFDIAHANAMKTMTIEEDREFLRAQRQPGRRGYLGPVDAVLAEKEAKKARRIEAENKRREKAQGEASATICCIISVVSYL